MLVLNVPPADGTAVGTAAIYSVLLTVSERMVVRNVEIVCNRNRYRLTMSQLDTQNETSRTTHHQRV